MSQSSENSSRQENRELPCGEQHTIPLLSPKLLQPSSFCFISRYRIPVDLERACASQPRQIKIRLGVVSQCEIVERLRCMLFLTLRAISGQIWRKTPNFDMSSRPLALIFRCASQITRAELSRHVRNNVHRNLSTLKKKTLRHYCSPFLCVPSVL